MLRIIPFALAAALAIPASAKAESFFMPLINSEVLPTVAIHVADGAKNGCWTNIGEAKTYATDKLENLGYEVFDNPSAAVFDSMFFKMSITSARVNGYCYGHLEVSVSIPATTDAFHIVTQTTVGSSGGIFTGYDNANVIMLDYIRDLTEQMGSVAQTDLN